MNTDTNHPANFASQATLLVSRMTREEKAAFVSGATFWSTESLPRLGLDQAALMSDGPIGLRKQAEGSDHLGLSGSLPATCFPAGVNIGNTWDRALAHELAGALAEECLVNDVAVILGPAMNMKRSPLCGRNFEYFSEDPHLAGVLATAYVKGAQEKGVGTSVKHFAANNQEFGRMRIDTRVDERTLRELYLPAFQRAITEAQPWTVMSAYNQINGAFCSENEWLLQKVLREEWGFQGAVVSDWGAVKNRVTGVACGLDLEMPTSGTVNDRRLLAALRSGTLDEAKLDQCVVRVVSLLLAAAHTRQSKVSVLHATRLSGVGALGRTGAAVCVENLHRNVCASSPVDGRPCVVVRASSPVRRRPCIVASASSPVRHTSCEQAVQCELSACFLAGAPHAACVAASFGASACRRS